MRENIMKPQFVYTGKKEWFNIRTFPKNINIPNAKPKENYGKIEFSIILRDKRTTFYSSNPPFDAINYAKRLIEPKGKVHGYGKARVCWFDLNSNEEYCAATVELNVKHYYEPVTRFKKKEKL